jgi:LCP family protein required for cell wall assembly
MCLRATFTGVVIALLVSALAAPTPAAAAVIARSAARHLLALAGTPVFADAYDAAASEPRVSLGRDGRLTVLLLGSDWRPSRGGERTDTIIVMSINPKSGEMAAVSIPRDTARIPLPNGSTYSGRVNALFGHFRARFRSREAGLLELKRTLAHVLKIEIDHYAMLRFDGYESLVDEIDGVRVDVRSAVRDWVHFPVAEDWELRGTSTPQCTNLYKTVAYSGQPGYYCHRALYYVQSRKGPANSDFKRTRRAQDIVAAALGRVHGRGSGANLEALMAAIGSTRSGRQLTTDIPINMSNALYMYGLAGKVNLTRQAVLSPSKYSARIPGTQRYQLRLAAVRQLTRAWFAPVR